MSILNIFPSFENGMKTGKNEFSKKYKPDKKKVILNV